MQLPFEFLGCMGCRQNLQGGYIGDYVGDYYKGY